MYIYIYILIIIAQATSILVVTWYVSFDKTSINADRPRKLNFTVYADVSLQIKCTTLNLNASYSMDGHDTPTT